jgi:hypothetical protein
MKTFPKKMKNPNIQVISKLHEYWDQVNPILGFCYFSTLTAVCSSSTNSPLRSTGTTE